MDCKTFGHWALAALIFVSNVVGQSMQNICLPLALSGEEHMAVVLVYMCTIYFIFFSLLDVILDVFCPKTVEVNERTMVSVGFQNALNGVGAIFGGSSSRTPLTLQMSSSLLVNLLAPFYKLWMFGIPLKQLRGIRPYFVACILYITAFALTLADKLHNVASGRLSGFSLLFMLGVFFGMTYNVHQDYMIRHIDHKQMTLLENFKSATSILRRQLVWLFIFSWIGVILAYIPGFDQAGVPTRESFEAAWAEFLPFGNVYMNLFNLGYIIDFIASIFMNKYDSSFNMLTGNVSAVLSLWTGWVASIRNETVGYFPDIALTVTAMVLSCLAIYPSYRYSITVKELMKEQRGSINGATHTLISDGDGDGDSSERV